MQPDRNLTAADAYALIEAETPEALRALEQFAGLPPFSIDTAGRVHRDPAPTFDVYRAESDSAWVVHVDTEGMDENARGPCALRVYINDGPTEYANPAHKLAEVS